MVRAFTFVIAGTFAAMPVAALADRVAYAELARGDDRAALAAIERAENQASTDPAVLINHGIALARVGEYDAARAKFDAALQARPVRLETATGDWVGSRTLARRGIALIEKGAFDQYVAMAAR